MTTNDLIATTFGPPAEVVRDCSGNLDVWGLGGYWTIQKKDGIVHRCEKDRTKPIRLLWS